MFLVLRETGRGAPDGGSPDPGSDRVEDDHRHGEGDQSEQLGGREADEQSALLAVGGGRIAESALEERAEDDSDARGGGADADRGETGSDDLGCFKTDGHDLTP